MRKKVGFVYGPIDMKEQKTVDQLFKKTFIIEMQNFYENYRKTEGLKP